VTGVLIGHLSDTHLGAIPYDLRERERDFYLAFDEAIDRMIQEGVDMVIHAGDIFDAPKPGGDALAVLARALMKLKERRIPFFFTLGEHDISRLGGLPSPMLYQEVGLATYLKDGEKVTCGEVTIVGYHKRRRSEIASLKQRLADLGPIEGEGKKVLVLHQGLKEFHEYAGEITHLDLPKGFDYYAMGHLHDRFEKKFDELKGPLCYPGSTEATALEGIKEQHKGFYIVDLSGSEAKPEWVELRSVRKQALYRVKFSELREKVESIAEGLKKDGGKPLLHFDVEAEWGEDVDLARVSAILRLLDGYDLYHDFDVISPQGEGGSRTLLERPSDIDEKMVELAGLELGGREKAEYAVKELLPLLKEGRIDEALESLWSAYKADRFGDGEKK
jgi:exonuclease SbcD